jgi:hypothetical protein
MLFGMLTAALLCCAAPIASADTPRPDDILTGSGLVCDTKEQAERFISLMGDNVESTLLAVNREAGDDHACVVATFGFVPGDKVADIDKDGTVVFVRTRGQGDGGRDRRRISAGRTENLLYGDRIEAAQRLTSMWTHVWKPLPAAMFALD